MDPVVSDPQPREARMLAAIVFTDVVGFSKLASQNEGRVYVALQRDMGVMTNLCRAHGGQVLNTMGDGMLLCFASAVDAMSCATEIQQTLYNQSHTLPATEVLHHRIGVHLGDVIMSGDNVFGDGVNVAARLQALAKPDAICFSNTVYEIVKNKLRIDAKYLGPRQLKNLGEPVRIWQIAPLGEGQVKVGAPDDEPPVPVSETSGGAKGAKAAILVVASLVLLGGLGYAFTRLKAIDHTLPTTGRPRHMLKPAENRAPETAATTGSTSESTDTGSTIPAEAKPDAATVRATIEGYKKSYDFEKIVEELQKNGDIVTDLKPKLETYQRLVAMKAFVTQQLAKTNPTTGVQMTLPNGEQGTVYISGSELYFSSPSSGTTSTPWPPEPLVYQGILAALVNRPVDGSTAPADGPTWVQLFSSEYPTAVATPGTTTGT